MMLIPAGMSMFVYNYEINLLILLSEHCLKHYSVSLSTVNYWIAIIVMIIIVKIIIIMVIVVIIVIMSLGCKENT